MPVAAAISYTRLREVFEKLGFFPRPNDPNVFERSDHLMFFPDIKDGKVTLIDVFTSIEASQDGELLTERFWEILNEMGGLD